MAQEPKTTFLDGPWAWPIPEMLKAETCDADTLKRVQFGAAELSDCVVFADKADAAQFITQFEARLTAGRFARWRDRPAPEGGAADVRLYTRPDPGDCWKVMMVSPGQDGQVWMGFIIKHCGGGRIG